MCNSFQGCEEDFIHAVIYVLNEVIGCGSMAEKIATYNDMLPLYRDVMHPDYLYFSRPSAEKEYQWVRRVAKSEEIVVQSVSSCNFQGKQFATSGDECVVFTTSL